jgi:hypothetical protein
MKRALAPIPCPTQHLGCLNNFTQNCRRTTSDVWLDLIHFLADGCVDLENGILKGF